MELIFTALLHIQNTQPVITVISNNGKAPTLLLGPLFCQTEAKAVILVSYKHVSLSTHKKNSQFETSSVVVLTEGVRVLLTYVDFCVPKKFLLLQGG